MDDLGVPQFQETSMMHFDKISMVMVCDIGQDYWEQTDAMEVLCPISSRMC